MDPNCYQMAKLSHFVRWCHFVVAINCTSTLIQWEKKKSPLHPQSKNYPYQQLWYHSRCEERNKRYKFWEEGRAISTRLSSGVDSYTESSFTSHQASFSRVLLAQKNPLNSYHTKSPQSQWPFGSEAVNKAALKFRSVSSRLKSVGLSKSKRKKK